MEDDLGIGVKLALLAFNMKKWHIFHCNASQKRNKSS
jgi:hypothetical protein